MRPNSLASRLIIAASLWSVAALIVAGLILTHLYRQSVEQGFDERLNVYLQTLVGALGTEDPTQPLSDPGNLGEQRFELIYSGWYWQVRQAASGQVVLGSHSLLSDSLDMGKATGRTVSTGITAGSLAGPTGEPLRFLTRRITLEGDRTFDFTVAGDAGELERQTFSFGASVAITLAVFGIGLIAATLIQIRWGLRPLDRMRHALSELRSGKRARIEGDFPTEISPLVKELNAVLESNQEVVDRARTQVGNLAHALKTPLSVVINEARASRDPASIKIVEQTELMRRQVNHYLDRARIAAQSDVIGVVTEVEPVIDRLVRVMSRLHDERGIKLISDVPDGARFKGEQQDFEEIVGNLVDNACKWAKTKVSVVATYSPPNGLDDLGRLELRIDDDGPGLTAAEIEEATTRGHRLDETKPGSGLGLSIVSDLVAMYRGKLTFDRARSGGLCAHVELPAA
jgi:signal transduction histidine kinase